MRRIWIILLTISTPLFLVSVASTYGPWNGSDEDAYVNAIICESNHANLCNLSNGQEVLKFEGTSAFIATDEPQLRTDRVVLNLPSKQYSKILSFIVTSDLTQTMVLIMVAIAALVSVILFLSIGIVPYFKRRTLLLVIYVAFAMPSFSMIVATPYPVGVATFAFLLYVFSTMEFLTFKPGKKRIALALAAMGISTVVIGTTRAEVAVAMTIFSFLTLLMQNQKNEKSIAEKLKRITPLAFSVFALIVSPQIRSVLRSLFGDFALVAAPVAAPQQHDESQIFVLTRPVSRIGNIVAAPPGYLSQLITTPWLETSIFLTWTLTFLLGLLFVIIGYILIKDFVHRKENRLVGAILASVIIFLPASSAIGTLRLYYIVPFGLMFIAIITDDALDLRLPLLLAAILVIIGNGISMARFTHGVESFHYYYFDLNPTTYYLIGQTSTILMVVSFFAVLYPDLQSERCKLGKSQPRLVRAKAVRTTS